MERQFREVVENIKFSDEEEDTLLDAFEIIQKSAAMVLESTYYDKDLLEKLNNTLNALNELYPRINLFQE